MGRTVLVVHTLGIVRSPGSKIEVVLEFLAQWQAEQNVTLGTILTAGELADVRELERIYLLDAPTASPVKKPL
jgi:hypothetical protein